MIDDFRLLPGVKLDNADRQHICGTYKTNPHWLSFADDFIEIVSGPSDRRAVVATAVARAVVAHQFALAITNIGQPRLLDGIGFDSFFSAGRQAL
jgi:hypothetical protein